MNKDVLEGKWHQWKGAAKTQWGKLTDDDFDQINGNIERLAGKIQERYGYARDRAMKEIDDFERRQNTATP